MKICIPGSCLCCILLTSTVKILNPLLIVLKSGVHSWKYIFLLSCDIIPICNKYTLVLLCFVTEIHFDFRGVFFPFNSSPPRAAYMWHSTLVQVMACRLFGAKPLPEPMQAYCQLDSWEQISVKFELEFYHFHSRKCIWKCRLPEWRPFYLGGDELSWSLKRYCHSWKSELIVAH